MMQAQRIASSTLVSTSGRGAPPRTRGGSIASLRDLPLSRLSSAPSQRLHVANTSVPHHADLLPSLPSPEAVIGAISEAVADAVSTSEPAAETESEYAMRRVAERKARRTREQLSYQVSAVASTLGMASLAILATYLRFSWHLGTDDTDFKWAEFAATLTLVAGGVIGMEMWARYAHKALWHDFEPGWNWHKSHHEPRVGPFEDNDYFAIMNAVPAMSLCAYGFFTPNMLGGVCFGAGLGITLFGIMYMFIHDGLVHKRFPVGPIAELPFLKRIAVAHTMHHMDKWGGLPWGLFLGPQELEGVPGAVEELDRLVAEMEAKALAARKST